MINKYKIAIRQYLSQFQSLELHDVSNLSITQSSHFLIILVTFESLLKKNDFTELDKL